MHFQTRRASDGVIRLGYSTQPRLHVRPLMRYKTEPCTTDNGGLVARHYWGTVHWGFVVTWSGLVWPARPSHSGAGPLANGANGAGTGCKKDWGGKSFPALTRQPHKPLLFALLRPGTEGVDEVTIIYGWSVGDRTEVEQYLTLSLPSSKKYILPTFN